MAAVTIPVMAKARIGHFVEAQVLEALGVDYIDESEVLTPADEANHIDKHAFKVPFVCGCRDLGEALRRISEGAAMMRTKGEAGTGNIVEAVRHIRTVNAEIRRLAAMREDELYVAAKELRAPFELVREVARRRPAAGRQLRRRRHRHPGRRGPRDAARRRRRLRGLGHLQERGPGPDGQRDRPGDDPLRQSEDPRRGAARGSGRRCAASPSRPSPRASASRSGAGRRARRRVRTVRPMSRPGRRGGPRCEGSGEDRRAGAAGRLRRAHGDARRDRRRGRGGAPARGPRRRRRPDPARRREHDDAPAHRPLGPRASRSWTWPGPARRSSARAPG